MHDHVAQIEMETFDDGGNVWTIKVDGNGISTALKREMAIVLAQDVLGCIIVDATDGIKLDGSVNMTESIPIDFQRAKVLFAAKMLWLAERNVRTPVEIVDEDCVEYEWGWEMHWRPIQPVPNTARELDSRYHFPFFVDRVTANVGFSGGTKGVYYGIACLLQERPEEFCGNYPYAPCEMTNSLVSVYKRLGAFEPITKKE